MRKKTFEEIKVIFKSMSCLLLSTEEECNDRSKKLKYICLFHKEKGIQYISHRKVFLGRGCGFCGKEKCHESQRTDFEVVQKAFKGNGFKLLSIKSEYQNKDTKLKCICLKHPEQPQHKTYNNIKLGHGCIYCDNERKRGETSPTWRGGITPLIKHMRNIVTDWTKQTLKEQNYTCQISDKRGGELDVHHLFSFNLILDEVLKKLNIPVYQNIGEYTQEELIEMEELLLELHNKYGGVVLTKDIHKEFHSIYGYGNNAPEQFYEFKAMKLNELNNKKEVITA